jgi:hypothetical protein
MDTDFVNIESSSSRATAPAKTGRPPPIILTSAINLIQLQKQHIGVVSENFEFRSTRNGTGVITKTMADFQIVKSHFDSHKLPYNSHFPKTRKAHKDGNTPSTTKHPCRRYF